MITNYPVGDFLIRLKNAAMAKRKVVVAQDTKLIKAVTEALKREKFIESFSQADGQITVNLAYKSKEPILMDIKLRSKLGLRIYMSVDELKATRGASTYIISTPKGVLSSKEAIKQNVGGEVIAEVY